MADANAVEAAAVGDDAIVAKNGSEEKAIKFKPEFYLKVFNQHEIMLFWKRYVAACDAVKVVVSETSTNASANLANLVAFGVLTELGRACNKAVKDLTHADVFAELKKYVEAPKKMDAPDFVGAVKGIRFLSAAVGLETIQLGEFRVKVSEACNKECGDYPGVDTVADLKQWIRIFQAALPIEFSQDFTQRLENMPPANEAFASALESPSSNRVDQAIQDTLKLINNTYAYAKVPLATPIVTADSARLTSKYLDRKRRDDKPPSASKSQKRKFRGQDSNKREEYRGYRRDKKRKGTKDFRHKKKFRYDDRFSKDKKDTYEMKDKPPFKRKRDVEETPTGRPTGGSTDRHKKSTKAKS